AWLFPGQGTQSVGMGKGLAEGSPAARAVFERADAALGEPLSKLCFEGPESDLTLTANTQPAILTASMASLEALREAFSELPGPAARAVEQALRESTVHPMRFPVVTNVEARPNREASAVAGLLVRQIDGPVLWEHSVRFLASEGVTHALEVGPGKVLAGLVRKI